jgi:hypothetical protein
MNFDRLIKKILVEDKDSEESVDVLSSRCVRDANDKEYDVQNGVKWVVEGKIGTVMIELIENALKQSDRFNNKYQRPQSIEEIEVVEITVDSLPSPKEIHCYLWWQIKDARYLPFPQTQNNLQQSTLEVTYSIDCVVTGETMSKEDELPISITLEQLKDIRQKEITDSSMKGHDFEDLYNL